MAAEEKGVQVMPLITRLENGKLVVFDDNNARTTWKMVDLEKGLKSKMSGLYKFLADHDIPEEDIPRWISEQQHALQATMDAIGGGIPGIEPEIPIDQLPRPISFQELLSRAHFHGEKSNLEAVCIVVCNIPDEAPIWMMLVAPPSTGKTTACKLCAMKWYTVHVSNITTCGFSPGAAKDDETSRTFALLDAIQNKTLLIDDLSPLLGNDERTRNKIIGEMTGMYGGGYAKWSPGRGLDAKKSPWNLVMGITPDLLGDHVKIMSRFGQRYIIAKFGAPKKDDADPPNMLADAEFTLYLNSIFHVAKARRNGVVISNEIDEEMKEYAMQICDLRSWEMELNEGYMRLYKQCRNFCITRASLYGRIVNGDDVQFFFRMALDTIPLVNIFKEIFIRPSTGQEIADRVGMDTRKIHVIISKMYKKGLVLPCENGKYRANVNRYSVLDQLWDIRTKELGENECYPHEDTLPTPTEEEHDGIL